MFRQNLTFYTLLLRLAICPFYLTMFRQNILTNTSSFNFNSLSISQCSDKTIYRSSQVGEQIVFLSHNVQTKLHNTISNNITFCILSISQCSDKTDFSNLNELSELLTFYLTMFRQNF